MSHTDNVNQLSTGAKRTLILAVRYLNAVQSGNVKAYYERIHPTHIASVSIERGLACVQGYQEMGVTVDDIRLLARMGGLS